MPKQLDNQDTLQEPVVTEEAMSQAFDVIHDEAARLLELLPDGMNHLHEGLQLIVALARYRYDIRTVEEKRKALGQ